MSDFVLYNPDTFADKVESGELRGFLMKRYVAKCYTNGIFTEDHEGYLVYSSKTGPSRAGLSTQEMVEYFRAAWQNGLNTEHPDVVALVGEDAPKEEKKQEPKKKAAPKKQAAEKKVEQPAEEKAPAQTPPPTVGDESRVLAAIAAHADRTIEAVSAAVPEDLGARLQRIEGSVDSLHDRVGGLEKGQGQIKAGVAYLAEGMMNPEARQEVVDIMDMSLDELVEAGFGKDPS